jgi:hypothetical protein
VVGFGTGDASIELGIADHAGAVEEPLPAVLAHHHDPAQHREVGLERADVVAEPA